MGLETPFYIYTLFALGVAVIIGFTYCATYELVAITQGFGVKTTDEWTPSETACPACGEATETAPWKDELSDGTIYYGIIHSCTFCDWFVDL